MARTTVEYWQHVGTGEVFAVRVDAAGQIVSARGPLSAADIGAALFGDPARGPALCALPTLANAPTAEETGAASCVHGDVELTHLRQFGLTHLFQVARSWRVPSSLVDADRGLCHLA